MQKHWKIELPECGILVGQAIYNTYAGYPNGFGWQGTNWQADSASPYELVDLTVKENQGNLVQFWWFTGGSRPQQKARYLALEDLNITIPAPDFENLKNMTIGEFPEFETYKESRAGAGVLKALQHAKEVGLYSTMIYCEGVNPEFSTRFTENVPSYIGYDFGERFTFRPDSDLSNRTDGVTLQYLADDFVARVSAHIQEKKDTGYGNICCTSCNFYMDYEVVAGVDFTMFEDCTNELNLASALSRGLCKQFNLDLWGSHIANEHYTWLPFAHKHRFNTLRSQLFMKYIAGAKVIISESGAWHCQTTADNSPQHLTPIVKVPILSHVPDKDWVKHAKDVKKLLPMLDRNSEYCRSYRKIMSDFYDYVKENGTPKGQPEVTVAIAKGNLDLCSLSLGGYSPTNVIGGARTLAERDLRWYENQPERGWETASKVFFPRRQDIFGTNNLNRLFSGTPWGQVDIVSFAYNKITADFLINNYKSLIFVGWNTCSDEQYAILTDYVKRGGRLFISIPQLSTNITRNFTDYTIDELVHGGDFSELCGVKVKGPGPRFYWGCTPSLSKTCLGIDISRLYGPFSGRLGNVEITDASVETMLFDHESCVPLLLRRKYGEGEVYFFNSWFYPGAYATEFGPNCVPDDAGVVGNIFRYLAKTSRSEVYVTDCGSDDPGTECEYINYSYFPEDKVICLFNVDFECPHTIDLHMFGKTVPVTVPAQGILQVPVTR